MINALDHIEKKTMKIKINERETYDVELPQEVDLQELSTITMRFNSLLKIFQKSQDLNESVLSTTTPIQHNRFLTPDEKLEIVKFFLEQRKNSVGVKQITELVIDKFKYNVSPNVLSTYISIWKKQYLKNE